MTAIAIANITRKLGEPWTLTVSVVDEDGEPVDLSAASEVTWMLKREDGVGQPYLRKQIGTGVDWIDQANGIFVVTILVGETAALLPGTYHHCATVSIGTATHDVMMGTVVLEAGC